jgi:hypothetical protein
MAAGEPAPLEPLANGANPCRMEQFHAGGFAPDADISGIATIRSRTADHDGDMK